VNEIRIMLDGTSLSCRMVAVAARGRAKIALAASASDRVRAAHRAATEIAAVRPVYGRSTGVGANRDVAVGADPEHCLRLLRSHACGAGPPVEEALCRATLVVRANQLAAGGSGVAPRLLDALIAAHNAGFTPPIARYGAIGTGDLTALATTALCLLGERPWRGGDTAQFGIVAEDGLAFMSSNAATIGEAAVACADLRELLAAGTVTAALTALAVAASPEPYAAPVQDAHPHPGQRRVAAVLRELLAGAGPRPQRIQDPFGLRTLPQVHGAAEDAADRLAEVLGVELNCAAENPLVDAARVAMWHNGNFHSATLALALDGARAALHPTAALSAARLSALTEPAFTGLRPFLADGPPASSGVLILEYIAHSALADLRRLAAPATAGSAVLSRGMEEHASFATQGGWALTEAIAAYRVVLACELVVSVRALRLLGRDPAAGPLRQAFARAAAVLDPSTVDRPLESDLAAASALLGPGLLAGSGRAGGAANAQLRWLDDAAAARLPRDGRQDEPDGGADDSIDAPVHRAERRRQ
jgi:histidine ammonia-lyase